MTLTKAIGLVLAACLIMILFADDCVQKTKKCFWKAAGLSAIALLTYFSWSFYVKIWNPVVDGRLENLKFSVEPFRELVTGTADTITYEIIKNFFSAFVWFDSSKMYNSAIPVTGVGFVVITVVLVLLWRSLIGWKRVAGMGLSFFAGLCLYHLMLLYNYVYSMNNKESALALASYKRYTATWWIGIVGGLLMICLSLNVIQRWKKYTIYLAVSVWMIWGIARIYGLNGQGYYGNDVSIQIRESISNLEAYVQRLEQDDRVYIISQDNGGMYLQALYALTPISCNPDQVSTEVLSPSYSLGYVEGAEGLSTDYSVAEWAEVLEDYDYVYVCVSNERFVQQYGALFESDAEVKDDTMYCVSRTEYGEVVLQEVELK